MKPLGWRAPFFEASLAFDLHFPVSMWIFALLFLSIAQASTLDCEPLLVDPETEAAFSAEVLAKFNQSQEWLHEMAKQRNSKPWEVPVETEDGQKTVNFDQVLSERAKRKESHALWLLRLGAKKFVENGVQRFIYPDNPLAMLIRANAYVKRLVETGILRPDEAVYTAIVLNKNEGTEAPIALNIAGDYVFVRPGIDKLPEGGYTLWAAVPQFKHAVWEEVVARGFLPVSLEAWNGMLDHDLAHLTELLADPRLMSAVREYYRYALTRDPLKRAQMAVGYAKSPELPAEARSLNVRLQFAAEGFSVVEASKYGLVRKALSEFFGNDRPQSFGQRHSFLLGLGAESLMKRGEFVADLAFAVSERHGGALRDPLNLEKEMIRGSLNLDWLQALDNGGNFPEEAIRPRLATSNVRELRENFLGMALQIRAQIDLLKTNPPGKQVVLEGILANTIARLETAIAYGVIDRIRPEDYFKALMKDTVSPDDKLPRYFARFAREGGQLWRSYLSPEASADVK